VKIPPLLLKGIKMDILGFWLGFIQPHMNELDVFIVYVKDYYEFSKTS
jgi:hypothetical protein